MSHAHHPAHALANFVLLPQVSGNGYYPYSPTQRQYGTQATVDAVIAVATSFFTSNASLEIGVGDMCFQHGGSMPPHASHRDGKEVDIRPLRKDRLSAPTNIHDPHYDRVVTARLVTLLLAHANVQKILFNDKKIPGVTHWPGHDNHLHVKMKS